MQIQPSQGQKFLTLNYILSCFNMVLLTKSVHSSGSLYLEAQSIVQNDHIVFDRKPHIITCFSQIWSDIFTLADDWNSPSVTAKTSSLYGKSYHPERHLNIIRIEFEGNDRILIMG